MLGAGAASVSQFATVTDSGSQPLTITSIYLGDGSAQYAVTGLPANFPGTPIVVLPGATFSFGVTFTPNQIGLQRGTIDILSNDPNSPNYAFHVTGTGLAASGSALHYGNNYVAIEFPDLPGTGALCTISDSMGNFSFFLPASTYYHLAIFDPISGLISNTYGTTAPSGKNTQFNLGPFKASTALDTGGDGLPDDAEFAIGLSPYGSQVSEDGIDYFTHVIIDHTNPLANTPVITGVVASLTLPGTADAVVLKGSPTTSQGQTAYVAAGSAGLAIVDASQFASPVLLGQISLVGNSTDVAVDSTLQIAAVASNAGGLNFVNVSNPTQPTLLKSVGANVSLVRVANGVAYAAVGGKLLSYDLLTGELLQTLNVSSNNITGLALDGSFVYALDSGNASTSSTSAIR